MRPTRGLLAGIAALTLCTSGVAMADEPTIDSRTIMTAALFGDAPPGFPDATTLSRDMQSVRSTMEAMQTGGYGVVASRQAELEAVLARAPTPFEQAEMHDGELFVRAVAVEDCIEALSARLDPADKKPWSRTIRCVDNSYPVAAFVLGAWLNEGRRFSDALAMLDRGLAFDPYYPMLVSEKGIALNALHRSAEALAAYEFGAKLFKLDDRQRGVMLRGQGYVLTDLNRLDDAEAAYKQSLKIDPNHGNALHELQYIATLRRGASNSGPMQMTSEITGAKAPH
jgi:Flp pilus assembly protein TadD